MGRLRLTYLASEYPAISHTFIYREIQVLRDLGYDIFTASIRTPAKLQVMTEAEREEASETLYVKARLWQGPFVLLRRLARAPIATLKMCLASFRTRSWKAPAYLLEAAILLEEMERAGSSHIHVHFANAAATVAWIASCSGLCSYSLSIHGPDVFDNVGQNLLAEKACDASFIRTISHYCTSQVQRWLPSDQWNKVHVVRCGVDTEKYQAAPRRDNAEPQLLCVGRLCSAKAQHMLVRASKQLREDCIPHNLVFVGDGPERGSLERLVQDLELSDTISFTGAASQDQVRDHYNSADVFVLPSFAEGIPVVLMEAMAKEIPVLTTHITGVPELITNGREGRLVPPADLDSLVSSLRDLVQDKEAGREMGQRGREKIEQQFNLQQNCRSFAELMRRYLEEEK